MRGPGISRAKQWATSYLVCVKGYLNSSFVLQDAVAEHLRLTRLMTRERAIYGECDGTRRP